MMLSMLWIKFLGLVTRKMDPPFLVPPGPNISKYLDPRIIYFNFTEIFGPPGTKISEIFGPSRNILSPHHFINPLLESRRDNKSHLKYLIP